MRAKLSLSGPRGTGQAGKSSGGAARGKPGPPLGSPRLAEVMSALVTMGWRPAEAEQAIADLPVDDTASLESLLRQALRNMPR